MGGPRSCIPGSRDPGVLVPLLHHAKLNKAKKSFLKNQITENTTNKRKFFGNYANLFSLKKVFIINRNALLKLKGVTSSKTTIANIFNNYFVIITKSLNIPAWNPENSRNNTDLEKILETFESHPSVRYIKVVTSDTKFSFQHVLPWETYQTIMELNKNKAKSGNIPTKTLKTIV